MSGLQVQPEAEAVEVPLDIVVCGNPLLKGQVSGELSLGRRLRAGGNRGDADLRALGRELAAEGLEVGARVERESPERLVEERRAKRDGCEDCGAGGVRVTARETRR